MTEWESKAVPRRYFPVKEFGDCISSGSVPAASSLPPKFPRTRSQIEQIICRANNLRIVLDDQNRISKIAQSFQNTDQPARIAWMQSNRRFIQNIHRAHQLRAQRSGKLHPLCLPARQRGRQPIKRQMSSPTSFRKPSRWRISSRILPAISICAGLRRSCEKNACASPTVIAVTSQMSRPPVIRRFAPHGLRRAIACRCTPGTAHSHDICSGIREHTACISFRSRCAKNPRMPGKRFIAVQNKILLLRLQIVPWHIQRKISLLCRATQLAKHRPIFRSHPWIDGAIVQCACFIWNDFVQIEVNGVAKSFATRACAIRIVKRKQRRFRLAIDMVAMFAGIRVRKSEAVAARSLPSAWLFSIGTRNNFKDHFSTFAIAGFRRIHNACPRLRRDNNAVDQDKKRL